MVTGFPLLAFAGGAGLFYTEMGSGNQMAVPGAENQTLLEQWTPDGKFLVARSTNGPVTLLSAPPMGDTNEAGGAATSEKARQVFSERYSADHFRASPDGKWVAYTSEESGRPEVTVAAFPSFTSRRQLSVTGGTQPQWRADGKEVFFHSPDMRMMAVDVVSGDTLQTGPVRELFRTNPAVLSTNDFHYAATPDGQRFLLREPVEGSNASVVEPLYVVTNWPSLVVR